MAKSKGQTAQWTKEKEQKDKQRPTKHTHKTTDRVTRTPLKPRGELGCSGRVGSSCSTSGTRRVNQHFLNRPPLGFPPPVSPVVLYELSIYHLSF